MNISAKFQLYPPYGCRGEDFLIFFAIFLQTNQNESFGQILHVWLRTTYQHTCQLSPINRDSPDFVTISRSPDRI